VFCAVLQGYGTALCNLRRQRLLYFEITWKIKIIRSKQIVTHLNWLTFKFVMQFILFFIFIYLFIYLLSWRCDPTRAMASSFTRFLDHTQRRTTVGRTPLDEWSARRRDLYLTTHNTHNRKTSMPPVEFETTISASERPQTYALDRAATEIGIGYW